MRWQAYGHGSEAEYFAWWCRHNIVQSTEPFDGLPLILEDWQLELMGEALAVDDDMRQIWESVALIVARKNGKTAMLAAYALYHLLNAEGRPEVLVAAASDKNARRLFDAVVLYIRANPELEDQVHIRDYIGEIVRRDGLGALYRLANDPTTLHGYNPSLVVPDELHAWEKPQHRKVWSALVTAGGSRTSKQVFTITTAGEAAKRPTSILGQMLDANEAVGELETDQPGLTISRNFAGKTLIYNYSAPTTDHTDVHALKLANPASWITPDGYLTRQSQNSELQPHEVLQFHGCVWAVGESTWIDPATFDLLTAWREVERDTEIVLAFDGSYSRDSTVLVGATVEEVPFVFVYRAWEKPAGSSSSWRVPRLDVLAAIEEAMEYFDVREFAPDPPGWHSEIEELEARYGEVVVRFETDQPRRMGPAADDFKQAVLGPGDSSELTEADTDDEIRAAVQRALAEQPELPVAGGLTHDGSEVLMRHLANCKPNRRGQYTLPTKDAPDSPRKIDAAIGAIVAYHRARWLFTNQSDDLGAIVVDASPPPPRPPSRRRAA